MAALGVVERALDGMPLYAARGELPVDTDEQRVQCHVCGRWYRALGSSHSWRTHGVTADEYRDLVGLRPRHALCRSARQPALVVPELLGQGEGAASE